MSKIEKEETQIVAYAENFKIIGKIFTPPGARLSDFMSGIGQKKFIPVKDAVVADLLGNEICRTNFLELNRDKVTFLLPESDLKTK